MRLLVRSLFVLLLVLAVFRAGFFVAYAFYQTVRSIEAYHLEPKMTHLAWRAQQGETLYPDWTSYPHVSNFFGPVYFLGVGWIGRVWDADLDRLYRIGRVVTIGSGLLAALLVGGVAWRREGRWPGLLAALVAIGAAPMIGFGAMVRPDVTADLLGFGGFLAATSRSGRWGAPLGGALLILAILTKQTAGLYLVAAVFALAVTSRRRTALALAGGCALGLIALVALVMLTVEPRFAQDLLGEAETPYGIAGWYYTLRRMMILGREVFVLSILGIGFWTVRGRSDAWIAGLLALLMLSVSVVIAHDPERSLNWWESVRFELREGSRQEAIARFLGPVTPLVSLLVLWAVPPAFRGERNRPFALLTGVLLFGSVVAALKIGSDLNYFLGPRLTAALGAAVVWSATWRWLRTRGAPEFNWRAVVLVIGLAALNHTFMPSLLHTESQFRVAQSVVRMFRTEGRSTLARHREIHRLAERPDLAILSDSGEIALRQKTRAPFVDPWLFRVLVTTGRVDPVLMLDRIDDQDYNYIMTTKDLFDENEPYDTYDFGLPPVLAEAARRRYRLARRVAGLFIYVPRVEARRPAESAGGSGVSRTRSAAETTASTIASSRRRPLSALAKDG